MAIDDPGTVFHPNVKEKEPSGTGLFCFLAPDRACGPDCMAYDNPPQHKDFIGKQWAHCTVLVNIHRTGKHLTVLAGTVDDMRKRQEDAARVPQPPPPVR